jgi:hypothetical protein
MPDLSIVFGLGQRELGLLLAAFMGLLIFGFLVLIFLSERSARQQVVVRSRAPNSQDPLKNQTFSKEL